jgi:hypothetical protein
MKNKGAMKKRPNNIGLWYEALTAEPTMGPQGTLSPQAAKGLAKNFGRILSSGRGVFEVIHEHPLKFYGYLLSCAKIPPAKKNDPDCNAEIRMLNNSKSGA